MAKCIFLMSICFADLSLFFLKKKKYFRLLKGLSKSVYCLSISINSFFTPLFLYLTFFRDAACISKPLNSDLWIIAAYKAHPNRRDTWYFRVLNVVLCQVFLCELSSCSQRWRFSPQRPPTLSNCVIFCFIDGMQCILTIRVLLWQARRNMAPRDKF